MTELVNIIRGFSKKEWIGTLLFFVVLMTTQIATGSTLIALFASAMGFLYVTLVRKGSRLCYIFGGVQIVTYIYISLSSKFYGDVMLNSFNLLMQPIGWYLWSKRGNDGIVQVRHLSKDKLFQLLLIWVVAILAYGTLVLKQLGGNTPMIDAITTVSSITAMILSVNAFKDQWLFWIICNATSVGMWGLAITRGDKSAFPMIIMWIAYLINSIVAKKEWDSMEIAE